MEGVGLEEGERAKLLYRGAEADVFSGAWCDLPAIYKVRKPLAYRLPELDLAIRGQRTVREAEMLHLAKLAGVPAPHVFYLSPEEALIVMERIKGKRLKALLESGPDPATVKALGKELGEDVARLHSEGIMHGDITTSNVVVGDDRLILIDFGLSARSRRLEDQAVDLRLIKEALTGAHNNVSRLFMRSLLTGYSSVLGRERAEDAARKLAEIERRGRYARVE